MSLKRRIVLFLAVAGVAVATFGSGPAQARGCQAFGQATASGAPWGLDTKANNANGAPGVIADNAHGAHATLCP